MIFLSPNESHTKSRIESLGFLWGWDENTGAKEEDIKKIYSAHFPLSGSKDCGQGSVMGDSWRHAKKKSVRNNV